MSSSPVRSSGADPGRYSAGDIFEVTIEKVVPRGFGLGFAEEHTVLVPLAAVGDTVRVRIHEVKKRTAFAEIVEVVRPGPERIPAPCPHYGVCGGCNFQHVSYPAQLQAKVEIIRDCLARIGKIEFEQDIPIVASPLEFEYRSRVRWHAEPATRSLGYMRRDSNAIVDITVCPILTPELQSTLAELRSNTDWPAIPPAGLEIEAVGGDHGQLSILSRATPEGAREVTADLGGEQYAYTAETFFQANRPLIAKLVECAVGDAAGKTALDLYCGVGLFTLPLARRFEKVIAVEGNALSAEYAKKNAANAGLGNISFRSTGVGRFLSSGKLKGVDLVLLDPPRSGPEHGVVDALAALRPAHISYVSCEPAILARDLRQFMAAGFTIDSIIALDMFPQTHHVETVVHLSCQA